MSPVCAIIGAGEGMGKALAEKFSSEGFDISLISRTQSGSAAAFKAANKVRDSAKVVSIRADAIFPESIEEAVLKTERDMGEIEVLVYNPRGEFIKCEPLEMTYASLENVYRLEVVSAFAAAKAVVPQMRRRGKGTIFFSSATAAFRGSGIYPLYSIGKFGVRALSQSLSKAYSKDGIHFVHVRLDCDLDVPLMQKIRGKTFDKKRAANTSDVATTYWHTYLQPKSAWSNEIELRPYNEPWTC